MCPAPTRCPAYRRCSLTCPCFLNSLVYTIYCVWTFMHSLCVCVHIHVEKSAHTEVRRQQWLSSSITAGYRSARPHLLLIPSTGDRCILLCQFKCGSGAPNWDPRVCTAATLSRCSQHPHLGVEPRMTNPETTWEAS